MVLCNVAKALILSLAAKPGIFVQSEGSCTASMTASPNVQPNPVDGEIFDIYFFAKNTAYYKESRESESETYVKAKIKGGAKMGIQASCADPDCQKWLSGNKLEILEYTPKAPTSWSTEPTDDGYPATCCEQKSTACTKVADSSCGFITFTQDFELEADTGTGTGTHIGNARARLVTYPGVLADITALENEQHLVVKAELGKQDLVVTPALSNDLCPAEVTGGGQGQTNLRVAEQATPTPTPTPVVPESPTPTPTPAPIVSPNVCSQCHEQNPSTNVSYIKKIGVNCYPFHGAMAMDETLDPVPGTSSASLEECQKQCDARPKCEVFVLGPRGCFLRTSHVAERCVEDNAYLSYVKDGMTCTWSTELTKKWDPQFGFNCYAGAGGVPVANKANYPVQQHLYIQDCACLCEEDSTCEAFAFHEPEFWNGVMNPDCYLLSSVDLSQCREGTPYDVYVKKSENLIAVKFSQQASQGISVFEHSVLNLGIATFVVGAAVTGSLQLFRRRNLNLRNLYAAAEEGYASDNSETRCLESEPEAERQRGLVEG